MWPFLLQPSRKFCLMLGKLLPGAVAVAAPLPTQP